MRVSERAHKERARRTRAAKQDVGLDLVFAAILFMAAATNEGSDWGTIFLTLWGGLMLFFVFQSSEQLKDVRNPRRVRERNAAQGIMMKPGRWYTNRDGTEHMSPTGRNEDCVTCHGRHQSHRDCSDETTDFLERMEEYFKSRDDTPTEETRKRLEKMGVIDTNSPIYRRRYGNPPKEPHHEND